MLGSPVYSRRGTPDHTGSPPRDYGHRPVLSPVPPSPASSSHSTSERVEEEGVRWGGVGLGWGGVRVGEE